MPDDDERLRAIQQQTQPYIRQQSIRVVGPTRIPELFETLRLEADNFEVPIEELVARAEATATADFEAGRRQRFLIDPEPRPSADPWAKWKLEGRRHSVMLPIVVAWATCVALLCLCAALSLLL